MEICSCDLVCMGSRIRKHRNKSVLQSPQGSFSLLPSSSLFTLSSIGMWRSPLNWTRSSVNNAYPTPLGFMVDLSGHCKCPSVSAWQSIQRSQLVIGGGGGLDCLDVEGWARCVSTSHHSLHSLTSIFDILR